MRLRVPLCPGHGLPRALGLGRKLAGGLRRPRAARTRRVLEHHEFQDWTSRFKISLTGLRNAVGNGVDAVKMDMKR